MDKKTIQSFRTKVKKANSSFSVMGDMLLCLQIDTMTPTERLELQTALASGRAPVTYPYLMQKVNADLSTQRSMLALVEAGE